MQLFALPDATIDRRDRAQWLTPPFDRGVTSGIEGPYRLAAARVQTPTACGAAIQTSGQAAEVNC